MFGFTARQLRDFRAKGALQHPEGVGRGAYYTEEHVHRLRAIRPLFNAGISVARIADRYRATDINAQLLEPPNEIQAPGQWQQARVGTGLHLAVLVDSTLEHSCDELLSHLVDEARKFLARRVSPGYRHETPG